MKCSICNKELDEKLICTITDNIVLGYFAVVLKGLSLPLCEDCFVGWNKIVEFLYQIFKEKKQIDEDTMKRILNENL